MRKLHYYVVKAQRQGNRSCPDVNCNQPLYRIQSDAGALAAEFMSTIHVVDAKGRIILSAEPPHPSPYCN